jgi:argininosuccinate lyase
VNILRVAGWVQVPFRTAHGLAGKAVAVAEQKGCSLDDLSLEDYQKIHPSFEADVADVWDFENSTNQ